MLKKIHGIYYPAAFVNWMIDNYGREELMPDDCTIMLMSICYNAGMTYGYKKGYNEGAADTEKLAEMDVI